MKYKVVSILCNNANKIHISSGHRGLTDLGKFFHGFLQLGLFLIQRCLCRVQALSFGLDDPIDATIEFHGAHPHA